METYIISFLISFTVLMLGYTAHAVYDYLKRRKFLIDVGARRIMEDNLLKLFKNGDLSIFDYRTIMLLIEYGLRKK